MHLILVILITHFFSPSCCKHVSLLSLITVCYPTNAHFFIDNFHFPWFVEIIQILPAMRLILIQSPQAGKTLFNSISREGQCISAFVTYVKVPNKIFAWQISSSLVSFATVCSSMILYFLWYLRHFLKIFKTIFLRSILVFWFVFGL